MEQQARERLVRVFRKRPEQPTVAEVQEHEISGHEPYRAGVERVLQAEDVQMPMWERPGVEKGVPIIGVDHGYLWSRAPEASDASHDEGSQARIRQMESELRRQCLCGRGSVDRWIFGHLCQAKGDNERNRAVLGKELQAGGYTQVVVRSVGEFALLENVEGSSCDDYGVRCPTRIGARTK